MRYSYFRDGKMTTLDAIVKRIAALQSEGGAYFDTGLFPAHRTNRLIGYERPDTTVFFTAVIVFTLQKIKYLLSPHSQEIVNQIVSKAILNYPKFQNKDRLKTYNFWKTKPSQHFPNGYIFRYFDHFRIPDDMDDTAMIYLTTSPTKEETHWLKNKLTQHANLTKQQIRNTYPEYRQLRAYSTWFGKNMYVEFDACVLSNILYWVHENQLPLNQYDIDSLAYIRSIIETNRYLTEPFRCAHQYPRTTLIAYHVARLMGAFSVPELEPIREKLIDDIWQLLNQPQPFMDEICLKIALMRLEERGKEGAGGKEQGAKSKRQGAGGEGRYLTLENHNIDIDAMLTANSRQPTAYFKDFYFFIAGLLTAYEHPLVYQLAKQPLFHIRWQCEAHCWTLVAEYLALLQED